MKRTFLIFILLECVMNINAQNDMFTLFLELVKPNYVMDANSYFEVSLTNVTSDSTFMIASPSDASLGLGIGACSWLIPEVELDNGTIEDNGKHGFFYFQPEIYIKIAPTGKYKYKFPIGYILKKSQLDKTKKLRVRLEHFVFGYINGTDSKVWDITIYSNWLDVQWEDFRSALIN